MWSVSALCISVSGTVLMTVSDRRHYSDPLAHGFISVPRMVELVKHCHRLNGRCPASKPGACEQTISQPEWTGLSSGNLRAAQGGCDESAVHVILGIVDPESDLNYNLRWMRLETEQAKCPECTLSYILLTITSVSQMFLFYIRLVLIKLDLFVLHRTFLTITFLSKLCCYT